MIVQRFFKQPTLNEWAHTKLIPTELVDFVNAYQANDQLWRHFQIIGLCQIVPITETVYSNILQEYIEISIGDKIVLSEGTSMSDLYVLPRMSYWLERYHQEVGQEHVEIIT